MPIKSQFSVLTAVYKNDDSVCFEEALESVFAQTAAPSEVVLVADGPLGVELEAVIEKYKKDLKIIRLKENQGLGAALRAGLKECSFPLVARMDSDDIAVCNRFELQLAAFEKDKDLAILGGAIEEIDFKTKEHIAFRRLPLQDAEIKKFLKFRCPFNHMTVMFKKADIESCGGYIPFYFLEDYYLWARCAAKGLKMANLEEVLVLARADAKLYARRGGFKYFKSNKALYGKMLEEGVINYPVYIFNIFVRFCVQVLMPNFVRKLFYKTVLRGRKYGK